MTMRMIHANDIAPQPWQNGGGTTRELLTWPNAHNWLVRISRAEITKNGLFSSFPDVERWFAVLEGEGVMLKFADSNYLLQQGVAPFCFAGDTAPFCELLDGPTEDLNLMIRHGTGFMVAVENQVRPMFPHLPCGLYTLTDGICEVMMQGHKSHVSLAAHTLLWIDDADTNEWRFSATDPSSKVRAWWLGYEPVGSIVTRREA
jgi:uncharacterized protein